MTKVFVYDHVRTPRGRGKKDGALHEVPSVRLAAKVLEAVRNRNGLDTATVDDIIMGCVDPVMDAGSVIPRAAAFEAGYSTRAPGMQISRFCASGLDAVNFGAAKIAQGADEIVIAGGVESMSRVGLGMSGGSWFMDPSVNLPAYFMPQGVSADLIATKYGFSRDDVDAYAVESQKRTAAAWDDGRFKNSVVSVKDPSGITILAKDEHMRPGTSMQSLAQLQPSFVQMGELGGFDARFRTSYDDVEFCGRLVASGRRLALHPGAVVLHHRRDTLLGFLRQQRNYARDSVRFGEPRTRWTPPVRAWLRLVARGPRGCSVSF